MEPLPATRQVVIIDDNHGFRRAAAAFLATLPGVQVAGEARDGLEGLALVDELRPDAVILDVAMPGLNGLQVARELRRRAATPGIVLVSVNADQDLRKEGCRIGVDAVLAKAELVSELPAALDAIFVGRSGHVRS